MVTRTKKIFVGGLSAPTTLEDVKNYFEQFGPVSTRTEWCWLMTVRVNHDVRRPRNSWWQTFDTKIVYHWQFVACQNSLAGEIIERVASLGFLVTVQAGSLGDNHCRETIGIIIFGERANATDTLLDSAFCLFYVCCPNPTRTRYLTGPMTVKSSHLPQIPWFRTFIVSVILIRSHLLYASIIWLACLVSKYYCTEFLGILRLFIF